MCEVEKYQNTDPVYFPPTYQQDGFVHATANPSMLLGVGNHFYKNIPGEWICLEILPSVLGAPVKFESPAPVGNTQSNADSDLLFPHIYGGISKYAVNRIIKVNRNEVGEFLSLDM